MLMCAAESQAISIDFYEDGVIKLGDIYDVVNIWNDATVDMTGGQIDTGAYIYNSGAFNIYDGLIDADVAVFDSGTLNLWGGNSHT